MVLPGHIAGGYLATYTLLAIAHPALSLSQTYTIYTIGIVASELPDIDIAILFIAQYLKKNHGKINHREYITHAPLFWLAICSAVLLIGFLFQESFIKLIGLAILCGTFSHFLLDSIEFGIKWIWPFNNKRYFLRDTIGVDTKETPREFGFYLDFIKGPYLKSWTFIAEIFVVIVAIIIVINTRF